MLSSSSVASLHYWQLLFCLKNTVIKDINLLFSIHVLELIKNLKKAENCFIAGGAKKLVGLPQELMEKTDMEVIVGNKV